MPTSLAQAADPHEVFGLSLLGHCQYSPLAAPQLAALSLPLIAVVAAFS